MRYAKVRRCAGGHVYGMYEKRLWRWRFNRCDTCDVLVLPFVVQYADPRFWAYAVRRAVRDVRYWVRGGSS